MSGLIVANLDAEVRWARGQGRAVRDLPPPVRQRVAAYGTLLRALRPDARRLWLPAPASVLPVPGLSEVEVVTGDVPVSSQTCLWAQTEPFVDGAQAALAAHVNDRRFAHAVAQELGFAIPGSGVVTTWDEVKRRAGGHDRWVLKAPFGTAGRDFVFGRRAAFDETHGARQAERLLDVHGALVFEPWLARRRDIGAVMSPEGSVSCHAIYSSHSGRFEGIRVGPGEPHAPALRVVVEAVAARLEVVGYRGPFGVDAFEDDAGTLWPLCEINARYTFGHVAHALHALVGRPRWGAEALALRFGEMSSRSDDALVLAAVDGTAGAWMTPHE